MAIWHLQTPFWYLITPEPQAGDETRWCDKVAAALDAQPDLIQFRAKFCSPEQRRALAAWLAAQARQRAIPLIINDDALLAHALGADGVHLGKEDGSLAQARMLLGPEAIIGASCYDSLDRAEQAVKAGASYLAFGAVFPSSTKPQAVRAPSTLFAKARSLGVPVVAIGGITLERLAELMIYPVDGVAVIQDVFGKNAAWAAERAHAWRRAIDNFRQRKRA